MNQPRRHPIRSLCQRVSISSSTNFHVLGRNRSRNIVFKPHRTHCGKLLVHFQWITFYERSDKFAVDDCLGGGDLTNAIDESCRWKRRRRTEVVLYREGGGNTTLARTEQIPRRFHSRGKVSVSIRKYPFLIDVRRSFVDDVERFGGWNWPEGLLKGRIKFR